MSITTPRDDREWIQRMADNCDFTTGNKRQFRVTLEVVTLLGMAAVLRKEPLNVRKAASEAILRHVRPTRCTAKPKHNDLNCVRNALAHINLSFHTRGSRQIVGMQVWDATGDERKKGLRHWAAFVPADCLAKLIADLAHLA